MHGQGQTAHPLEYSCTTTTQSIFAVFVFTKEQRLPSIQRRDDFKKRIFPTIDVRFSIHTQPPPHQQLLPSILCFPAVSVLINQALGDHAFQNSVGCGLAYLQQPIHITAHDMTMGINEI